MRGQTDMGTLKVEGYDETEVRERVSVGDVTKQSCANVSDWNRRKETVPSTRLRGTVLRRRSYSRGGGDEGWGHGNGTLVPTGTSDGQGRDCHGPRTRVYR